jgi:hypothetical protein
MHRGAGDRGAWGGAASFAAVEAAMGLVWKEKEEALGELHQLIIMTIFGGSQGNHGWILLL